MKKKAEVKKVTYKARQLDIHGQFKKIFEKSNDQLVDKQAKKNFE